MGEVGYYPGCPAYRMGTLSGCMLALSVGTCGTPIRMGRKLEPSWTLGSLRPTQESSRVRISTLVCFLSTLEKVRTGTAQFRELARHNDWELMQSSLRKIGRSVAFKCRTRRSYSGRGSQSLCSTTNHGGILAHKAILSRQSGQHSNAQVGKAFGVSGIRIQSVLAERRAVSFLYLPFLLNIG